MEEEFEQEETAEVQLGESSSGEAQELVEPETRRLGRMGRVIHTPYKLKDFVMC